jgi:hypothetical protein
MTLGLMSHSWSGGRSGSILSLPPNARFLARGFQTSYDPKTLRPERRRALPKGFVQPSKPQQGAPTENTQLMQTLQKLMKKESPQNPSFSEFSQRRQVR